MARPRVFVSSTYYDLRHIRASLEVFIKALGYEPVLSESGHIPYVPDIPLDESCYREVLNSDIYVLIIGGRYGSEASALKSPDPKGFFDFYQSITKREHNAALEAEIPIYILIERAVYSELQTYRRNKDNNQVKYAHVDSVNIFFFIDEILTLPRNNPIQQFDKYSDIENWLKEQWAGYYKELLNQRSNREQIRSLAKQVKTLEAQIGFLSEVNKTLKTYLENIVSKVSPTESDRLIQDEDERLENARRMAIEQDFPQLSQANYRIIGPSTSKYNSFAWAIGDTSRIWSPISDDWPEKAPKDFSLESVKLALSYFGYTPCEDHLPELGFEKVAVFSGSNGEATHVARQMPSGTWTSKLGTMELIEFDSPDLLEGTHIGTVVQVLKRPLAA